jgi:HPt (histidine-containing phosphotransfer) domain-containing protein
VTSTFRHLNPASIREAIGDSPDVIAKVAILAEGTLGKQLEICRAALQSADQKAWYRGLHAIRGSLAALGAELALVQLQQLDQLAAVEAEAGVVLANLGHTIAQLQAELLAFSLACEGEYALPPARPEFPTGVARPS